MKTNYSGIIIIFITFLIFSSIIANAVSLSSETTASESTTPFLATSNTFSENDTTPPHITLLKPENALYINNKKIMALQHPRIIGCVEIQITAEDNETGINQVFIYIDDILRKTFNNTPYVFVINERSIGKHNIRIEAYDNFGNKAELITEIYNLNLLPNIKHCIVRGQVVYGGGIIKFGIPLVNVTAVSDTIEKSTMTKKIPVINRGDFIIRLPPGVYTFIFKKSGYRIQHQQVVVTSRMSKKLYIELERQEFTI